MLTNVMGVDKAHRRAILKALRKAPTRILDSTAGAEAYAEPLSIKKTIDNWAQLLYCARERMSGARSNSQEVAAPAMKNVSDDDWEAALEQTADRPSLDSATAEAAAAAAARQAAEMPEEASAEKEKPEASAEVLEGSTADSDATGDDQTVKATDSADAADALEELKTHIKALERELTLVETKRDILRQQLEMSEQKAEILRDQLIQWQQESESVRRQFEESREINRLNAEEVERLKQDNENIAKTVNIAWQQGYLAGRAAAEDEEKQRNIVEQLSKASGTKSDTSGAQPHRDETVYVIADSPVIEDPEVLNDPFTAKLLNALQAEAGSLYEEPLTSSNYDESQLTEEIELPDPASFVDIETNIPQPPPLAAADHTDDGWSTPGMPPPLPKPDPTDDGWTTATPQAPSFVAGSDGVLNAAETPAEEHIEAAAEPPEANGPSLPPPIPTEAEPETCETAAPDSLHPANDPNESSQRFTADELHSLFRNRMEEKKEPPPAPAQTTTQNTGTTKKFVGSKHATSPSNSGIMPALRVFPPEIRKACRLLGLNPEDVTTRQIVTEAWKKEMSKPGVHPDTGGDTEMAIYLNTAKDALMRWVDDQTPKLGKKFGAQTPKQHKPE